ERVDDERELCRRTAARIANGDVVGWFQGRMEWGPRALGNRSIVCDPRRADMKNILNQKIKRRESFRPFAPSVLRDAVGEWFETALFLPLRPSETRGPVSSSGMLRRMTGSGSRWAAIGSWSRGMLMSELSWPLIERFATIHEPESALRELAQVHSAIRRGHQR